MLSGFRSLFSFHSGLCSFHRCNRLGFFSIQIQALFIRFNGFVIHCLANAQRNALVLKIHTQHLDSADISDLYCIFNLGDLGRCALRNVYQTIQTGLELHESRRRNR